ncbi:phosphoribulokinase [Candidatus Methylocalor cossyra]|uniref:phosphoribulokinase n=1 Tax=Candidatus Methylocalor cossyra TaxID=3108543 RepID=A0ABM9NJE3_9GAMM
MSRLHPVIVFTGSAGAGLTTVRRAFTQLCARLALTPLLINGEGFQRYGSAEMEARIAEALRKGEHFSHFALEAYLLEELEETFRRYGATGRTRYRHYIHSAAEGEALGGYPAGTFTPWEESPPGTDLLLYEGLHGAVKTERVDLPRYADLLVGVVPIINLEWIQKIHRDTAERGYRPEDVTDTILRRMPDYVNVIAPQFSRTDINFQRVPLVDTSNPFIARDIPTADESVVVIRFKDPRKFEVDFRRLLARLDGSYMSRYNSIVIPGGQQELAMELIFLPILERLVAGRCTATDR